MRAYGATDAYRSFFLIQPGDLVSTMAIVMIVSAVSTDTADSAYLEANANRKTFGMEENRDAAGGKGKDEVFGSAG